ncbi:DGQHR domain-containing protein [Caballeronia telluris]|uniref:DGQHR domain protein n=1 Tax=Caballeronia telluris TaxID=326475 RepID=A0A158HG41_9BURK|nr:DGQHR domain-containing protein [Caballeronia telluris]SAL43087.1 hypothetical protein AWB66_02284 [Caballeronia telluris]
MSKVLVVPAARVQQGGLTLFMAGIKVREIVSDGFFNVETLDPDDGADKGYQRLLNVNRAKKLADYVLKGQKNRDAFLPTSILLATDKSVAYNEKNNTIEMDLQLVGPFSVVDGQHRLEGLRMAAERDKTILDFEVPVNIAVNLPKIDQMCHFLIVNTTQKSVDKAVEQRIIARLTDAIAPADMPSLPKWIFNRIEKGDVDKAIKIVDYLNATAESPWLGKIQMANAEKDKSTVNQRSFIKAILRYVLVANNPLSVIFENLEEEKEVFLTYWKAIKSVLDNGNSSTLYKSNGVDLFCRFSTPFFMKLQNAGRFDFPAMATLLRACLDHVEGEYSGVAHPDWWVKGGRASFLNSGAIHVVLQEMIRALHKVSLELRPAR